MGGSFRSSDIEKFAFEQGSMNAVVIWLVDYPHHIIGIQIESNFLEDKYENLPLRG